MTGRETRDEKLQSVLSCLDEIEKLQLELRKIVPRSSEQEVISDESAIDGSTDYSESIESDRSVCRSVDSCQQTERKNVVKEEPSCDSLTYFWSPEKIEAESPTFKDQQGSRSSFCYKDQSDSPKKSVSVSVQTGQKRSVDVEPFDLLDYLRLPANPKAKLITSIARRETPGPIVPNKPSGPDRFSWLFGSSMEEPDSEKWTKNGHRGMASSDSLILNGLRTFTASIGSKGAAAEAQRTPAASAKLDQQQVVGKKVAVEGKGVESFLEAKSQGTGDVVRRVGSIRVPLREARRSRITEEWKPAITMGSGLAGSSTGYRGNKLDNSNKGNRKMRNHRGMENDGASKKRMFKWFHKNGDGLRSARDVEDKEEWEPEEGEKSNERRSRPEQKSKCWGCCNSGSEVAEVVVPYHHPGDRTPRLVESLEEVDSDKRTETLRVVSSAAKVKIRKSSQYGNFLSRH